MSVTETEVPTMERTLTAQDRCDRCGAPAVAATEHGGSELLWCNHHLEANLPALIEHITVKVPVTS